MTLIHADGDLSRFREIAVVLGGGLRSSGAPTESTLLRADAAVALARTRAVAIIVSGSHGNGPRPDRSEARLMGDRLIECGIAPARIFLEDQSRDTLSNAAFVAERYLGPIGPRPLVVVTSPFHMARALATFALVLGPSWTLEAYPSRAGTQEDAHAATEVSYLAHTRARLEGLQPGDIRRIAERVRASMRDNVSDDAPEG